MVLVCVRCKSIFYCRFIAGIAYFKFHIPILICDFCTYPKITEFNSITKIIIIFEINTAIQKHASCHFTL